MTMIDNFDMKCAVCGETSSQPVLMSTNSWGYPDLDLRPPEMKRSTMNTWVLECPHCGYISGSIDWETPISKDFLESEEYKTCDYYDFKRPLAARFYRNYLISKETGNKTSEFLNLLHCVWVCDDAEDILAVEIRLKAIEIADQLIEANHENKKAIILMKADMMRRANRFSEVIEEFENAEFDDEQYNNIIKFQIKKAKESDNLCYTVEDVVNNR